MPTVAIYKHAVISYQLPPSGLIIKLYISGTYCCLMPKPSEMASASKRALLQQGPLDAYYLSGFRLLAANQ